MDLESLKVGGLCDDSRFVCNSVDERITQSNAL